MEEHREPTAEVAWAVSEGRWTRGHGRLVLSGVFLVYLLYVGIAVADNARGGGEVAGFALLGAFAAIDVLLVGRTPTLSARLFWPVVAVMFVLFVAELPFARAGAFVLCLYVTAALVARLEVRAWPAVVAMALAALVVPALIPGWHDTIGADIAMVTPVAIPVIALAQLGVMKLVRSNDALARAQAEVARLTAENERSRIARDLHDLLGHSLTTITVKAGLAHRVGERDVPRALHEIAEVEELARRSLHDVRAAVANYREVTLTGELASGRELLRAAGIAAELPSAVDGVDPAHQELFGWVVREGLTNVVRHARAGSCAVRLTPSSIEILDDGIGGAPDAHGSGLAGLRERVSAAGGVVEAGPRRPAGWRLRVSFNGARPS